ncbi:MAG: hypothetical protein M3Y59_05895 [Myxococcota bacterium]|nr:hypothetical protein [Myxococcota bacterium]
MNSAGPAAEVAHEKTESEPGTLLLEIGRVFDVPEAWLVRDAITRAPPDLKLTLDFHRTAELHDFALAVLIELLSRENRKVEIHGLNAHQQSLLRLLGRPLTGGTTVVGDGR